MLKEIIYQDLLFTVKVLDNDLEFVSCVFYYNRKVDYKYGKEKFDVMKKRFIRKVFLDAK